MGERMKFVYLLPFSYFYDTRLRNGSLVFHFLFEWIAAVVLALILGFEEPQKAILSVLLSYFAFISLYEIGYLVNDLVASRKEVGGRLRGPQNADALWLVVWCASRLLVFMSVAILMGRLAAPEWWSFFAALSVVFILHNELIDRELKGITFLWLAWFRFMAPVIFIVQDNQRLGIGLAAAMAYASFRLFGYLDSKGLLQMPGRKRPKFRMMFFLMPLSGVLALWTYDDALGFIVLTLYYAVVSVLGTLFTSVVKPGN